MSILRRWNGTAWEDVTNNFANTPTAGGAAYGTGSTIGFTAAGTAGQSLLSGGAGAPTWGPTPIAGSVPYGASASTEAYVPVGTTGQVLVSAGATAPAWAGGPWTSWVPALTAATTNPTLGAGSTATGSYCKVGNTVVGWAQIVFGSSGTNAGSGIYSVSIPFARVTAQFYGTGRLKCAGLSTHGIALIASGSTSFQMHYCTAAVNGTATATAHNLPGAWGTSGDYLSYWFVYECT